VEDKMKDKEIIEKLAELEHQQWMKWSKEIVKTENITTKRIERWMKLWKPYKQLPEKVREQDRVWAKKVLKIFNLNHEKQRKRIF
jgi:hypothetical protein